MTKIAPKNLQCQAPLLAMLITREIMRISLIHNHLLLERALMKSICWNRVGLVSKMLSNQWQHHILLMNFLMKLETWWKKIQWRVPLWLSSLLVNINCYKVITLVLTNKNPLTLSKQPPNTHVQLVQLWVTFKIHDPSQQLHMSLNTIQAFNLCALSQQ